MADHLTVNCYYFTYGYGSIILVSTENMLNISAVCEKRTFDLSTYLRRDNSVDMLPPTLANCGSNSTVSDQVILFHIKYF